MVVVDFWDWAWLVWIALFFVIELPAIFNDRKGDTLSEHFADWFNVATQRGRRVWVVVCSLFFGWFIVHILVTGNGPF